MIDCFSLLIFMIIFIFGQNSSLFEPKVRLFFMFIFTLFLLLLGEGQTVSVGGVGERGARNDDATYSYPVSSNSWLAICEL